MEITWILFDTASSDAGEVSQIVAQKMYGWQPEGEPFVVELAPSSGEGDGKGLQRGHGLRAFVHFVDNAPMVSHNLHVDLHLRLGEELKMHGLVDSPYDLEGLCSQMLGERLLLETESRRLEVIRKELGLAGVGEPPSPARDVATLVELWTTVYRRRLRLLDCHNFSSVVQLAIADPPNYYRERLRSKISEELPCGDQGEELDTGIFWHSEWGTDLWSYQDDEGNRHDGITARDAVAATGGMPTFVWRKGLVDWVQPRRCEAFVALSSYCWRDGRIKYAGAKNEGEFVGICRGVAADGRLTNREFFYLHMWLTSCELTLSPPIQEIDSAIRGAFANDGIVTAAEKAKVYEIIRQLLL